MPAEIVYPLPRVNRTGPAPSGAGAVTTGPTIPRMRIFSLARDAHANDQNVMVSPRITGPAIIKDVWINAPFGVLTTVQGVKIFVSDDNSGGVVSTTVAQFPTGTVIFEDLLFKYNGIPPNVTPFLHGYGHAWTVAQQRNITPVIPLEYVVYKASFFIKVYIIGDASVVEGQLRVLEGIDPATFF